MLKEASLRFIGEASIMIDLYKIFVKHICKYG